MIGLTRSKNRRHAPEDQTRTGHHRLGAAHLGLVSLVYVTQLLDAAVKQTYETNRMVANQVRFALQQALEEGLKDRTVDPNNPAQLRTLEAQAIHDSAALQAVIDSVNRYSLTVYDINIGDSAVAHPRKHQSRQRRQAAAGAAELQAAAECRSSQLYREVFGPPKVFDVVVPLERNGEPFATVHVGVRTTLLRAAYAPWLHEAFTLTGFALGTALIAALLLSNLALRPLEEISMQLDYWTAASESPEEGDAAPRQDTPNASPPRSSGSASACAMWKRCSRR